jgi:hypothetical protein
MAIAMSIGYKDKTSIFDIDIDKNDGDTLKNKKPP